MSIKVDKFQLYNVMWNIVYYFLLHFFYLNILFPVYSDRGFYCNFDVKDFGIATIALIPALLFLAHCAANETLSKQIASVIIYIGYFPSLVLACYIHADFLWMLIVYYLTFMVTVILLKPLLFKRVSFKKYQIERVVLFIFIVLIIYIWGKYSKFHIQTDIINVYEQRAEAASYSLTRLQSYMYSWAKVIVPLLAIWFLHCGKKVASVLCAVVGLIAFSIDGSKSLFFTILLSYVAYYTIRIIKNYIRLIPVALSIGVVVSYILYKVFDSITLASLLFRRVLFVPAKLHYDYYSFFSDNVKDYFRTSFSLFGKSPYNNIAKMIGEFNGSNSNCNNGLFSDAYMNLGWIGMIVMPILIVLVLKIMEGAAQNLPSGVSAVLVLKFSMVFISSSFFTSILTHGIFVTVLLLYFVNTNMEDRVSLSVINSQKKCLLKRESHE